LEQSGKAMADAYQLTFEGVTSGRIEHPTTRAELTRRLYRRRVDG
jgi:hypothetical protein